MKALDYKSAILLAYQLLDALYSGDAKGASESSRTLYNLLNTNTDAIAGTGNEAALQAASAPLSQLVRRGLDGEDVSMREYNTLRTPLAELIRIWMRNIKVRLFYQNGTISQQAPFVQKGVPAAMFGGKGAAVHSLSGDCIQVFLAADDNSAANSADKFDVTLTVETLIKRVRFCFPIDVFDYDRLYLSGKLKSLSSSRRDVSIVLGGSSYAMVGLTEDKMPRPAVNLAVNAQDPYFTFLAAEKAMAACKKINAVVVAGGYYFWHTDMSDNPSDYYKSVLTRTNYPIFKSLRNYRGEVPPPLRRAQADPFMEKLFDFEAVSAVLNNLLSTQLERLAYFSAEINPRPVNGMLQYPFREQSDGVNDRAAMARAVGHNGNFNPAHLEENARVLTDFLTRTSKRRVKVILIVPPVTRFYRPHCSPELIATVRERLEPLQKEFGFTFLDLFGSPDFDDTDFQDYDHLNARGAEKLSAIVAGMV